MFADGAGAAAGATGTEGTTAENNTGVAAQVKGRKGSSTANVVYGKQSGTGVSDDYSQAGKMPGLDKVVSTKESEERDVAFENMIKGEYKEAFHNRVQKIVQSRIGETKMAQQQLDAQKPVIEMLSRKYGIDATDVQALQKAIEEDDSFFQEEATRRGMSVEQLKEVRKLETDNNNLREAMAEIQRRQQGENTYNKWMQEASELQEKYGLQNFDFAIEAQNPEFANLLKSGVSVEGAYKAIHFDEMMGGAMAATSHAVGKQIANNLASRASRPVEGAISSQPGVIVKSDVSKLTKADRQEIARRVARGEAISF